MGLDGLLRSRARRVSGILNGIDDGRLGPGARHACCRRRYDAAALAPRARNKAALQARMALAADRRRAAVRRRQPADLAEGHRPAAVERCRRCWRAARQLAVLGSGDAALEAGIARRRRRPIPGGSAACIGYDEPLAHLIQAGADALLVPSRFEPCGLTQLCALRYGAVPVVARVGGLADTVIDANAMALAARRRHRRPVRPGHRRDAGGARSAAPRRCTASRTAWRRMQANGMATDVSWRDPGAPLRRACSATSLRLAA